MPKRVSRLLVEFFTVLRWKEEWDFIDYIQRTLQGKAVLVALGASLFAGIGKILHHPIFLHGAVGALTAALILSLWEALYRLRNLRHFQSVADLLPEFVRAFRIEEQPSLAQVEEMSARIHHDMREVVLSYEALVRAWDVLGHKLRELKDRKSDNEKSLRLLDTIEGKDLPIFGNTLQTLARRLHVAVNYLDRPYPDDEDIPTFD